MKTYILLQLIFRHCLLSGVIRVIDWQRLEIQIWISNVTFVDWRHLRFETSPNDFSIFSALVVVVSNHGRSLSTFEMLSVDLHHDSYHSLHQDRFSCTESREIQRFSEGSIWIPDEALSGASNWICHDSSCYVPSPQFYPNDLPSRLFGVLMISSAPSSSFPPHTMYHRSSLTCKLQGGCLELACPYFCIIKFSSSLKSRKQLWSLFFYKLFSILL